MLIGILSDSHGRADRVRLALQLFDRLGAGTIIHCGDVGGHGVFDELVGRDSHFVWGNMDEPDPSLLAYLEAAGLKAPHVVPLKLELAGRIVHVFHGHEPGFRRALVRPQADYVLHGHTHVRRDERIGGARVINPGALYRARSYSVATLELPSDIVEFHEIDPASNDDRPGRSGGV